MKFLYEFRSKDNVRHTGVVFAANREAAFGMLKARGIRPGSMTEAPGFFNKLFGKGKRWLAICALCVALVIVIVRGVFNSPESDEGPLPRHQIYGDPARVAEFERSHFMDLMPTAADAYLAHFAQPGRAIFLGTNDEAVVEALSGLKASGFRPPLELADADRSVREASEIKRIVMAMREEFRAYVSDGVGTPTSYLVRLKERLRREREIYALAQSDLARTEDDAEWDRINKSLRSMGLPTVPRPESF